MVSLKDKINEDAKLNGVSSGGNFYKVEEGNGNVIRILTVPEAYAKYGYANSSTRKPAIAYDGDPRGKGEDEEKKSLKYLMYVLDRNTGKILVADLPRSVIQEVGNLQENPDFTFEDFPMPYDIRITYDKKAAPSKKYTVQATKNESPLTEQELIDLGELNTTAPILSVLQKLRDTQRNRDIEDGLISF